MYSRFLPLTLIDLVPDVIVGLFPHPGEFARLVRTLGAVIEVDSRGS